jgi:acetylglutamate kinase
MMHVLKIGGNELHDPGFLAALAQWVAGLPEPVVIVHGGARAINGLQTQLGMPVIRVDGLRVTDREGLRIAQMVLSGQSNKQIVRALINAGVDAIGLSGVDGGLVRCHKKQHPTVDLGYVGEIAAIRTELLHQFIHSGLTIVLSPISLGFDGYTYNINADEVAAGVAAALKAHLLNFVSNVPGVLHNSEVLTQLTVEQTERLINDGVITDGMVPKVRAATAAITQGVKQARIVNLQGLLNDGGTTFS